MSVFRIPPGVKDLLPRQSRWKRETEEKLAHIFSYWGYDEVVTPTFEYYQALTTQGEGLDEDLLYKFIDREGKILVLRPDMTTPIARLVSGRMTDYLQPLRLFYTANVFRYEKTHAGRQREFFQAGVELIGATGAKADVEVLSLAISALEAMQLDNFRIGIGQVEVTKALLGQLNPEAAASVRQAMARKDMVELESLLKGHNIPGRQRDVLLEVTMSQGGLKDMERLLELIEEETAHNALTELVEVFRLLEYQGFADKIFFDLGIFRDFDYYTGIVFEGYVPQLGFPVCGGGRYDNLLGNFGHPAAATGFALGLERIMLALNNNDTKEVAGYLLVAPYPQVLTRARELRAEGKRVVTAFEELSRKEAETMAKEKGLTLIYGGGE
ncbi:ATP phosphoribosyltransferase regulatory subunit [Metallumcola ferriviriculae]|uniref:ATP phosphoribosyltransferase regulatory subunit n=1 Tax=Metallumcola ferriviriculae TaxID=3039180 RepID=A0AAU0US88_9FIRM|nr:ATP phosphoribosyltransferase regulatory subunit [Desulfitibacteraceae bacterium MK1]